MFVVQRTPCGEQGALLLGQFCRGIPLGKKIISARIRRGMNDPDPKKRAQWEVIPHEGEIPTPEEGLYYAVNTLIENGDEELLRRYPNL